MHAPIPDLARCPLCGTSGTPNVATFVDSDGVEFGRDILICACGRALWMEEAGWFVSFDFIARLAIAIRTMTPQNYASLLVALAQVMPQEIQHIVALLRPA